MTRVVPVHASLLAALLAVALAACSAPGDYFDRWFGSGPAQKPAELVVLKPTASAKILWQGNVGTAYRQRAQIMVFLFIFIAAGLRLRELRPS